MDNLVRKFFYCDTTWTVPAGVREVTVTGLISFAKQSSNGRCFSVAVKDNCDGYAWGDNLCGKLGVGTVTQACVPTLICCGLKWKSLSTHGASGNHVLGIATDGTGYAWGDGGNGRIGNCTTNASCLPTLICCNFKWKQLIAGGNTSIGITKDGDAYSWGSGTAGRLGNGTATACCIPSLVSCAFKWRFVATYNAGSIGITTAGDMYTWGDGSAGTIGNGSTADKCTPTLVNCGLKWKFATGGGNGIGVVMGITCDGDLYSWGTNTCGVLGDGTITLRASPVRVCAGVKWKYVSVGGGHAIGITCAGDAYAWGNFACGVGGDGTITTQCVPTLVSCAYKWRSVEAGSCASLGITLDGCAYSWGMFDCGAGGDGSVTSKCVPTITSCGINFNWTQAPTVRLIPVSPGVSYPIKIWGKLASFGSEDLNFTYFTEGLLVEYYA